jgi:hypothetical protein
MRSSDMKAAFTKSPPQLIRQFEAAVGRFPELERRAMFGYPAVFLNGQMVSGLFADYWGIRLAEDARRELLATPGAGPFEPMPGRPMKEYVAIPPAIATDPDAVGPWLERAMDYVRTLPPKATNRKR